MEDSSSLPQQLQEDEDNDSAISLLTIPPEEWMKLIEEYWENDYDNEIIKEFDIEIFKKKFMEHPKIQDFINWRDASIANGGTMLTTAIWSGRVDIAKLLLENGADITIADEDGDTPLLNASKEGLIDIVELLLDMGADIKIANKKGETALMHASSQGLTDIAKLLVDKGADINNSDTDGWTALMYASNNRHIDIVKLLVDKGADITNVDEDGSTALMFASSKGRTEIVKLLVDKGADINSANKDGMTSLMWAVFYGHMDIVKLLVNKGVDVTVADNGGNTALMKAYSIGQSDIVKLLVENGADDSEIILLEWKKLLENWGNDFKNIAIETITQWLEHPKKERFINWNDSDIRRGETMLQYAMFQNRLDIAELLVEHGADIHILDLHGYTASMYASHHGHTDMVKLLVDRGADINSVSKDGMTALSLAFKNGHTDIAELLVDRGADIKIASEDGMTVLMYASKNGLTDIVKRLLEKGADINTANNRGTTAFMYASQRGQMDIMKLLLDNGADSNVANNDGMTALMFAVQGGHTEIVQLLTKRSLSQDIGSLLDAGVTIERLEELYPKKEVQNVFQARIVGQTQGESDHPDQPAVPAAATSTLEVGDEENVEVPPIPDGSKVERSQSMDIATLADAGVTVEKLEELYPKEEVHKVLQARIVKQTQEEDEMQRRRRGSMARLLFLRSKSTALKEVLRNSTVMDQVLISLLADPEEKILMCPLMLTPLKDPVVISSGFVMDRSTALDEEGNLRVQLCPFSRKVLCMPVYACIPIRSKLKAWEAERMNRCIEVAEKMVESKEWDRATKVFDIAETLLQEMGDKTYVNLATKLADLERKIPPAENDTERIWSKSIDA